jgi:hypothetical protein
VPFAKLAIVMPHSGHSGQQDPKYNCKYPRRLSSDDRQLTLLSVTSDHFTYNFSEHDQFGHSQDASGPTLMNHEQQSYLNGFFDNPDQATTNNMDNEVVPYNFAGFEMNDRSGMNALNLQMASSQMSFGLGIGNSAVHMPAPGVSTPRYTSHMAPPGLSQYDASRGFENFVHVNEQTPSSQTQSHITHDDQAASALMSMSSHSQEHSQATAASGVNGSSWGDFNLGDASGIAGEQLHSPMVPNASSSGSNTTPLTPTFGDNFLNSGHGPSHAQFHQQSLMQQATQQASYVPARHQSMQIGRAGNHMFDNQLTSWQTYQAQMDPDQSQRRPPIVQYGSDQNFNNGSYRAAIVPASDDKYTNLLNIPLVSEVSQTTHTPFPTPQQAGVRGYDQQQRHNSFPSSLQQLSSAALTLQQTPAETNSPTYQHHNDQLSVARAMENLQGSQPPQPSQPSRKRRRSQDDDQDAGPQSQTQPPTNAPRRAPVVPKQESTNDNNLYSTPAGSAPKRRRSDPRPKNASSSASPSTPARSNAKTASSSSKKRPAEPKPHRANLSDTQKRNNHIASEQKRRDAMKTNYEDLNRLVPTLQNGQHGMSRSEILQNSADYLESVTIGNNTAGATYGLDMDAIRRAAIASVGAIE